MITRHRRQSFFRRLWLPLVTAAFLGYFGFHAFTGSFGIWEYRRLEAEAARLKSTLDTLRDEKATIERRVSSLWPDSLDADVVDTEARSSLNVMRANEVVVSFGATQKPARQMYGLR